MQLTWRTNIGVSCFHAADLVRDGRTLRDVTFQQALDEPVEVLTRALAEERLPQDVFWEHVVPLAAEFDGPRQLAEVVLTKLQGSVEARIRVPRFERHLRDVRSAFLRSQPELAESLPALVPSVQQAWNLHGAGLLSSVPSWTDPDILIEEATVFVVPPFAGGAGAAHLPYNSVRIEAAEDHDAELPEALRLAWLLAQLNLDIPRFSENIARQRQPLVAGLAMAPVLVAIAESTRLLKRTDETLGRALRWLCGPSARLESWAPTVAQWWETYLGRRPSWSAALTALDRLLQE